MLNMAEQSFNLTSIYEKRNKGFLTNFVWR